MNGRILVGGGTGFIGREIVKAFERLHYEVVVISRKKKDISSSGKRKKLHQNFFINFDTFQDKQQPISNTQTWYDIEVRFQNDRKENIYFFQQEFGLPSGTVAVVNTAGQNLLDPLRRWSPGFRQDVYNSRINTNYLLAKAIAKSKEKPKAFIHMSGVGYYPTGRTESLIHRNKKTYPEKLGHDVHDESSEGGKHDFLARLVTDWEKAALLPVGSQAPILYSDKC